MGLWNQSIAFCFYLQFMQHLNFWGIQAKFMCLEKLKLLKNYLTSYFSFHVFCLFQSQTANIILKYRLRGGWRKSPAGSLQTCSTALMSVVWSLRVHRERLIDGAGEAQGELRGAAVPARSFHRAQLADSQPLVLAQRNHEGNANKLRNVALLLCTHQEWNKTLVITEIRIKISVHCTCLGITTV